VVKQNLRMTANHGTNTGGRYRSHPSRPKGGSTAGLSFSGVLWFVACNINPISNDPLSLVSSLNSQQDANGRCFFDAVEDSNSLWPSSSKANFLRRYSSRANYLSSTIIASLSQDCFLHYAKGEELVSGEGASFWCVNC